MFKFNIFVFGTSFSKKFWRNFPKVEDSSLKEAAKKYGKQDFWTANFHLHTVCPISSPHSCLKCRMPRIPNTPRKKPTWHYGRWSFPSSESSLQRGGPFSGVLCLRCFVPFFFAGSNRVTRQAVKVHLRLMCRGVGCLLVAIRCFVLLVGLKTQGPVNGRYIHRFDMEYSRKGPWKLVPPCWHVASPRRGAASEGCAGPPPPPEDDFDFSIGTENRNPRTQTADGWGLNQKGSNCDRNPKLNLRTFSGNQKERTLTWQVVLTTQE